MTRLKHLLMVLAILVPAFASAQAEVPDYSRLTAEHHPRLFLDNQEFEAMKSLIGSGTPSYLSDLHDIIMEICRLDAMKDSPLEYKLDASDKRILHVSRDALTRIFFCAYATATPANRFIWNMPKRPSARSVASRTGTQASTFSTPGRWPRQWP